MFTMMEKSPRVFVSNAGQEFLIVIANVPCLAKHDKNLRKLLLFYKKKDFVDKSKRSLFYSVMLKVLNKINKLDQFSSLSILSTTNADLLSKEEG